MPVQDPHDRRAGAGAVAAGDDAELQPVAYSMAFPPRELTVDFQVGSAGPSRACFDCYMQ